MSPDRMHERAWFPREDFKVIVLERRQQPDRNAAFWKIFLIACLSVGLWVGIWYVSSWLWEVL